ncbi:MAG: protein kinase, partial [Dehalococcoidia bacterium]|nr:protein kinase [Dehalococcoidia bacterium]
MGQGSDSPALGPDDPTRPQPPGPASPADHAADPTRFTAPASSLPPSNAPAVPSPVPARLGRYTIRRILGEGGMGTVYLAEQENPRREVALKVIRAGYLAPELLRRFELESQVLGRLQHPGIAQIYEAGVFEGHRAGVPSHADDESSSRRASSLHSVTSSLRHSVTSSPIPFFAMEFIRGVPLTEYADSQRLGTRQRLELLAKVCDAVYHAHQKGVIHRDLKPGNILVADGESERRADQETQRRSEAGGSSASSRSVSSSLRHSVSSAQPKILDFGVARATDSDIQQTTMQTDVGQLIGTVPYMSPEQVTGDPNELDTRSDVYALGVIAYELLAGRLPHDLRRKMIHEAARIIREEEPTRLSSINRTLRGD